VNVTNIRVVSRMFSYHMDTLYLCNPKEKKQFHNWAFGNIITKDHATAWNKKHGHQLMINEDFSISDIKKIIDYYETEKRKI
jgi:hypothetical protein